MSDDMFSKKCNICGTQPAMLFFRTLNGDHVGEEGLCPKCALKRFSEGNGMNFGMANDEILKTINEMRHILTDIVGHIGKAAQKPDTPFANAPHQCNSCNIHLNDIKKNGVLGCPACYDSFKDTLKNKLLQYQFGPNHLGQIPDRYRQHHLKKRELEKLRLKLRTLLKDENYEEAAKIHKRIKKIEIALISY